jgi:hypothetical protein
MPGAKPGPHYIRPTYLTLSLLVYPEHGGSMYILNISTYLSDYTVSNQKTFSFTVTAVIASSLNDFCACARSLLCRMYIYAVNCVHTSFKLTTVVWCSLHGSVEGDRCRPIDGHYQLRRGYSLSYYGPDKQYLFTKPRHVSTWPGR